MRAVPVKTLSDGTTAPMVTWDEHTQRWVHRVRQSTLGDLTLCAERTRYNAYGLVPRVETDSTAIGTSLHRAIEVFLAHGRDEDEAFFAGGEMFDSLLPSILWTSYTEQTALDYYRHAYDRFLELVVPALGASQQCEVEFEFPLYEDDDRVIVGTGTIDCVDSQHGLLDWKTGKRKYSQNEKQRSSVQASMYTLAAHTLGFGDHTQFTFVVFPLGARDVQWVTVQRAPSDWRFLEKVALQYCQMVERQLDAWPMNDNGWHCSERWCQAYDRCKAAQL